MKNIERPLTWVLIIVLLAYLVTGNCCKKESTFSYNNTFQYSENEVEGKSIENESVSITVYNDDEVIDSTIIQHTTNELGDTIKKRVIKVITTTESAENYNPE